MIMPITPRKSRQLCRRPSTFRTKQPGAFSSPTPTPGPKLCFRNLPELSLADKVVLADIYAARETDTLGISSRDLQKEIQKLGTECFYFPTFDEIENFLLENCVHGDLLITMGAGDVVTIGEKLLGQ